MNNRLNIILAFLVAWEFFFYDNSNLRISPYIFWPVLSMIALVSKDFWSSGRESQKYSHMMLLPLSVCSLSILFTSNAVVSDFSILVEVLLYFIAIRYVINRLPTIEILLNSFLLISCIHLFFLLSQLFLPSLFYGVLAITSPALLSEVAYWANQGIFFGLTGQTSTISTYLIIGFAISLYKTKGNLWFYVLAFCFYVGILLTNRRGAFIDSSLLAVLFFALDNKKIGKKAIVLVAIIGVIFAIGIENIPGVSSLMGKFDHYANSSDMTSGRADYWDRCLAEFDTHKLLGIGFNKIPNLVDDVSAHNSYLQKLAELGIIGTVLFFLPMLYCLLKNIKLLPKTTSASTKSAYIMLLMFQVFFLVIALTEGFYETPILYVLIFAVHMMLMKQLQINNNRLSHENY